MTTTFTFTAGDKQFTTQADNFVSAMDKANREFLDVEGIDRVGAWNDGVTPNTFYWTAGNFFD